MFELLDFLTSNGSVVLRVGATGLDDVDLLDVSGDVGDKEVLDTVRLGSTMTALE